MSQPLIYTRSDLYNEFYALLGSKIKFTTTDGEYEGILKLILPKKQRVTFEHVYYVPTQEYMGNLHFFFHEFLSYDVIKNGGRSESHEKWSYLSHILDRKFANNHYRLRDLFNDELDESQSEAGESVQCCGDDDSRDDFVYSVPHDLKNQLPADSVILDACDEEFDQAIDYLLRQRRIGVSFEGPKISRFGKLSWISISSPDCVFLFDIELLGEGAFKSGLKKLLEDNRIEKVIHDCRQPSDILVNKYDTELKNVFDTQVADYIVNLQRYTDKPDFKYVSSLDCCLVSHLSVPQEFLHNRRKHISYALEENFFKIRPVSPEFRNVIVKNVLYLVLLRNKLSELMMSPFQNAVDVYLKVLANASEPELLLEPSVPDKLPPALVFQGIQTVRFQELPSESFNVFKCGFKDPRNQQVINIQESQKVHEADTKFEVSDFVESVHSTPKEPKIKPNKVLNEIKTEIHGEVVDQLCIGDSRSHIDNTYHHLASNNNALSSAVNIDVKPSSKFVSNVTVRKSGEYFTKPVSESKSFEAECDLEKSQTNAFGTSTSSGTSADSSFDSNDSWSQLRSAFGASCYVSEESQNSCKNIKFLPAGMYI